MIIVTLIRVKSATNYWEHLCKSWYKRNCKNVRKHHDKSYSKRLTLRNINLTSVIKYDCLEPNKNECLNSDTGNTIKNKL